MKNFSIINDMTIKSDVIIKACKLLDEDQQIGLVAPKIQEIIHGNLPGVTNRIKSYGVLLSKIHIIRKSVLDKMGFFDEKFRTYHIDDDSCLSVLNLGYTIIFTKDVGVIHYRIRDEKDNEARAISTKKLKDNSEKKYFEQKWKNIEKKIEKIDKIKYLKYTRRCDIIYFSNILSKFVPKSIYDIFLEKSIIFNDKKYNDLRDFYLAQKYPVEIIRNS